MTDYGSDEHNPLSHLPDDSPPAIPTEDAEWLADDATSPADDQSYLQTPPPPPAFVFEDLNLLQALELLIFRPIRAGRELFRVALDADRRPIPDPADQDIDPTHPEDDSIGQGEISPSSFHPRSTRRSNSLTATPSWLSTYFSLDREKAGFLGLLFFAIIFALIGSSLLRDAALDPVKKANNDHNGSEFWLILSAFMYLTAVVLQFRIFLPASKTPAITEEEAPLAETEETTPKTASSRFNIFTWVERYAPNLFLLPIALLLSWLAYARNEITDTNGNVTAIIFTRSGAFIWFTSILLWYLIFMVDLNRLYQRLHRGETLAQIFTWRPQAMRWRWTHLALALIMLVSIYLRLHQLDAVPPEMTSDHIEKLINAVDVQEGFYAMFFANNGGREAAQMYLVAAIADWGGVGFNMQALKYASIIEGLLSIFLSFWLAKAVIGRQTAEREQIGDWAGLLMAGLMAISSWHIMLSRLGLRIILTPLSVLLVTWLLARAIRYRRRMDFVNLGLILGFGTYLYQANRMLPILVVISIGLAIIFNTRGNRQLIWRYTTYLLLTGIMAIVIYLPMHRYAEQYPREFWSRTYGRMFGERSFDCLDEEGRLDFCPPSTLEMLDLLRDKNYGTNGDLTGYGAITQNYKTAFTSYMWNGDRQWITNGGGYPALDSRTAAFYMLGGLMWLVLIFKWRDPTLLIVPVGILVMILPSALAIARGLSENPSFTRLSGTIPFVYLLAAMPLSAFAYQLIQAGHNRRIYHALAAIILAYILYNTAKPNYDAYFNVYREGYENAWKPYHDIAAPLREFADGEGSFGNAFYVHYEHWLDHRILGAVAGDFTWPNGLVYVDDIYTRLLQNQDTPYAYDPEKPLLFYVNRLDTAGLQFLQENFPGGQVRFVSVKQSNDFYTYEVPAGWDWLASYIATETARLRCFINCLPGPR